MNDKLQDIAMVRDMRRVAGYGEIHPLRPDQRYLHRCRRVLRDRGVSVLFTRDTGHHSTGWWKNPDYERCWHLSLAFFDPIALQYSPQDTRAAAYWIDLCYGDDKRYVWAEPPYFPEGKRKDVHHYRLFVAPDWRTAILPRGEVYSRQFTERGWKSWSDARAADEER